MNPHRNEVTFRLGEQDYTARATFDVIARLEARFGPIVRIMERLATRDIGVADTAAMVGIILGKAAPKPAEIGEAVLADYLGVQQSIVDLVTALFAPADEEQDAGNAEAAAT